MAMTKTTVRLPESLGEAVEREADEDGVSVAQFIRDSLLLRLGYRAGKRGDVDEILQLLERVKRESPD